MSLCLPGGFSVKHVKPELGAGWSAPGRQCCCWCVLLWESSTRPSAPWGTRCLDPVREPTAAKRDTTEVGLRHRHTAHPYENKSQCVTELRAYIGLYFDVLKRGHAQIHTQALIVNLSYIQLSSLEERLVQRDWVKEETALGIKLQFIKRGNSQEVGKIEKWNMCDFVLQLSTNLSPLILSHSAAVACRRQASVYKSNNPFAINSSSAVITR